MKLYQKLEVWQLSMQLVVEIYDITKRFPKHEVYGLTNQIRRCSVSIPSNIAEGYGRKGNKEFKHFLRIANGSLSELETQVIISQKLGYINSKDEHKLIKKCIRISNMIFGLMKHLENNLN
jgi:four helix bundle protein